MKVEAIDKLFADFDAVLKDRGYLAMGGQIIDATVVPAPKQRNTEAGRAAIKEGRVPEGWKLAKARQKDRDARWSIKYSKSKVREGAAPGAAKPVDLAIPMFGYKNHVGIDKVHGLIRTWRASAANAHDGARLPDLVSKGNTGSGVWADTAYRSRKNEAFLADGMFKSPIHQRRKPGRLLSERTAKSNGRRSRIRAQVEHMFAGQKHRMRLIVRTIGIVSCTRFVDTKIRCFWNRRVMMERRKFSREFKLEAVKLVLERGVSAAQAARDLDVHANVLRKWIREAEGDPGSAFPGHGNLRPEQQEIERLRRELARMKAERDILKKAAAYFAKDSI